MLTLIAILLSAPLTFASSEIEVLVKHKYSENRTHIYEKRGQWFCDTELQKRIEIKGKTKTLELFPRKMKKPGEECISQFRGVMITAGAKKRWQGCTSDPEVKPFLKSLNRECAR